MSDYDWPDFPVIYGQGSVHDLRDAEYKPSRLAQFNFRSVKNTTSPNAPEEPRRNPIGFHSPSPRTRR